MAIVVRDDLAVIVVRDDLVEIAVRDDLDVVERDFTKVVCTFLILPVCFTRVLKCVVSI